LIDEEEELRAAGPAKVDTEPKLESIPPPIKKSESPVKKKPSRNAKQPRKKRQKREETPSEDEISEALTEESTVSDFKYSDDSEMPTAKRKSKTNTRGRPKTHSRKRAKVESDESEGDISEPSFIDSDEDNKAKHSLPKKAKGKPGKRGRPSAAKIESDEESAEERKNVKTSPTNAEPQRPTSAKLESADEKSAIKDDDSDSEAGMIIGDEPRPKQKGRSKSETSSSKASKPKVAPKELSPDEVQIKTLQSQLTKCGLRKIWGIELKKFGDDNQKKIRHLQGMLRDVGMTGRFSEQRAREIKELRELQADLEAVQEGDSKWGLQSGRRARAQRKSVKEISDEDENGDDNDDGDGFNETDRKKNPKVKSAEKAEDKAARAKQELAFLGDEESDSD
jgi:hypothetical protein